MDCLQLSFKKQKEIVNIEKSLQDWKLPPSSASDVFKRNGIFNFSHNFDVNTVEEEIPLCEGYARFPLFTDNLKRLYENKHDRHSLYMGMIQIALKPTKLGLNMSAIICLRTEVKTRYSSSLFGVVESSLRDGPIHFSYFPSHCVDISNSTRQFTIDIKTEGCSKIRGDENLILMYKFHYKIMGLDSPRKRDLNRRFHVDKHKETTFYLTNIAQSNRVVSKKIIWDQVTLPARWMLEYNVHYTFAGEEGCAALDWKETAEAHVVKVDVPGLKKEEVKIEVDEEDGSILQISGERSVEQEDHKNVKWYCMERKSNKFLRNFQLPENANTEQVTAEMENGVLTVTIPKEEVKKKAVVKKVVQISG